MKRRISEGDRSSTAPALAKHSKTHGSLGRKPKLPPKPKRTRAAKPPVARKKAPAKSHTPRAKEKKGAAAGRHSATSASNGTGVAERMDMTLNGSTKTATDIQGR